ncbi:hemicentin-2-like [Tropilaelaps mercedesae]|uniref:Hemicentin-2-like n=1 Tax=Tropilaelaps mercedesae TaxID=418985 RepID=A0A1V9XVF8_9ACAR|nr:hemicentin-2-like [Tropilaelaps mercedesae]
MLYFAPLAVPRVSAFDFPTNSPAGSRIKAVCSSSEEARLSWLKDGVRVQDKNDGVLLDNRGDLLVFVIKAVRPSHSGNYTCLAENVHGKASYSAILTVAAGAEWLTVPRDQKVVMGTTVELVCEADGFPPPKVTWSKNDGTPMAI